MQTKADVTRLFMADLTALLRKWGAEIEADDHYQGYPECGEDIRIEVTIPSQSDDEHQVIREFTTIDLGRWVDSDSTGTPA